MGYRQMENEMYVAYVLIVSLLLTLGVRQLEGVARVVCEELLTSLVFLAQHKVDSCLG